MGEKKHFILRPLQPFNNPSLIIEPNELIFFFSLTFQYMYVFYSSPGEKKYLEKNIF